MSLVSFEEFLPPEVMQLLRTRVTGEFATVSAAGVPIDTPTYYFPNAEVTTLDIGTGLAYPAKAERARRNLKVGMLIEGAQNEPVISVAGRAAVHDSDIQANLDRYLAETIFSPNVDPEIVPWEKTRQQLYYLSRIIVAVAPVHVRWWPSRSEMNQAPNEWRACPETNFPSSDPAPQGKSSEAPSWRLTNWQEMQDQALAGGLPAHMTLLDEDGYPIPIRVIAVEPSSSGFRLLVPRATPWSQGAATLSFVGKEIFVGKAVRTGDEVAFDVERCLPVLPMMDSRQGLGNDARRELDKRLKMELARRNQPMPVVPEVPPEPTQGAWLRAKATRDIDAMRVGGCISR